VSAVLRLAKQLLSYLMIFLSTFFRTRASLGCELVAIRSQLTFYKESIRQKKQPRPRFAPAFRLLWVWLSTVWSGWKSAANLMKPRTVLKWHEDAFLQWCAGNLGAKEDALNQPGNASVYPTTKS
jgi:hypothetical protein